jgi:hypothetical protein
VVYHKKTGHYGTKNTGKGSDAGGRSSGHNPEGSSSGSGSNKTSGRDRTKSGIGRSSDSSVTGNQSARDPPPCLNTKKFAGEKHYFSDCPHTRRYEAIFILAGYKKKRYADKKKEGLKTLGSNGAMAENIDGQNAYLTAENLGLKLTVLADTDSEYSAMPRSDMEDVRKRGFPLKEEGLPEPIIMNMATRGESDTQKCSATDILMSAVTITTPSGAPVHNWSSADHCRRRYGPSIDWKTGLGPE